MILFAIMVPLLLLCCLPAIGFGLYDRWIPVGSLWETGTGEIILVTKIKDNKYVNYSYLSKPRSGGNAPKGTFAGMTTRIPDKDKPLYLLANIGE